MSVLSALSQHREITQEGIDGQPLATWRVRLLSARDGLTHPELLSLTAALLGIQRARLEGEAPIEPPPVDPVLRLQQLERTAIAAIEAVRIPGDDTWHPVILVADRAQEGEDESGTRYWVGSIPALTLAEIEAAALTRLEGVATRLARFRGQSAGDLPGSDGGAVRIEALDPAGGG